MRWWKTVQNRTRLIGLSILALASGGTCWGIGFTNGNQDAQAMGRGNAFTAQADSPAAIYYNPAGIIQVSGTAVSGGAYFLFPSYRVDGDLGTFELHGFELMPHFYVTTDLGTKDWRIGLGINSPFGASSDWSNSGPISYAVTDARVMVINMAPTVAYRIDEHWSVGGSVNVYYGRGKWDRAGEQVNG